MGIYLDTLFIKYYYEKYFHKYYSFPVPESSSSTVISRQSATFLAFSRVGEALFHFEITPLLSPDFSSKSLILIPLFEHSYLILSYNTQSPLYLDFFLKSH